MARSKLIRCSQILTDSMLLTDVSVWVTMRRRKSRVSRRCLSPHQPFDFAPSLKIVVVLYDVDAAHLHGGASIVSFAVAHSSCTGAQQA